ncbi:Trypsin-like serine protease [Rhodospirillaceae bacterium LM-1]|nr:Trypsin-like serine protease [Rhodospirillaceae bacterium LM-1]
MVRKKGDMMFAVLMTKKLLHRALIALVLSVGLIHVGSAANPPEAGAKPTIELARGLIDAEQFELAVAVLKQLEINNDAMAAQVDLLLGRIYLAIGKPAKALEFFEHASMSSLDSEAESYIGMADAQLVLGDLSRARKSALMALKTDPDIVAAHLVLAIADQRIGHNAEAMTRLRKLQRNRPDQEDVALVLARYITLQEGPSAGIRELETFIRIHPTAADAKNLLGQLLWAAGRKAEAVQARTEAKQLYLDRNRQGSAAAMVAWLKAVDPQGQLKQPPKAEEPPKALAKVEEPQKPLLPPATPPIKAEEAPKFQAKVEEPAKPSIQPAPPPIKAEEPQPPLAKAEEPPKPTAQPRTPVQIAPLPRSAPEPLPFAPGSPIMTGSGIVLEGGRLIITNKHVIEGTRKLAVRNGTGYVRIARLIKVSKEDDLALLEISKPFPEGAVTPFADLVDPVPGRAAIVMGFPLISILGDEQPALTEGIVAKTSGVSNDPNTFQMTTKINKGNSGGPVFDKQGRLIGVTMAKMDVAGIFEKSGTLIEDISIGIKASRILHFLGKEPSDGKRGGAERNLEDLYQEMLPRAVLVAAQK